MEGKSKGQSNKSASPDTSQIEANKLVAESVRVALNLLATKLNELGVSPALIDRAMSEISGSLKDKMPVSGVEISGAKQLSDLRKTLRKDFFGRAVLFHIEDLFPMEGIDEDGIHSKHADGALPREVAGGLVHAIKLSNDSKSLSEYEDYFVKKAERYRRKTRNNEVDVTSFANDGGVRSVARNMIKKFESAFNNKGEEEGRKWLIESIESHPHFEKIGRELTDEEYETIRSNIFRMK